MAAGKVESFAAAMVVGESLILVVLKTAFHMEASVIGRDAVQEKLKKPLFLRLLVIAIGINASRDRE